jgi:hypothetical protein
MDINLANADLTAVTPEEFAKIIMSASNRDIAAVMSGPDRNKIIDEVFSRMEKQFRPDVGANLAALIRWSVTGGGGDAETRTYELNIANGTCTVSKGESEAKPRVAITTADVDFLKLVSGNASGPMLFMTRKLKADGDLGIAASLTQYFAIPKA